MKSRRFRILALLAGVAVLSLAFLTLAGALSGAPAFDRGLPTANLNNVAGSSRSNVAWSNGNDYISGDSFTVGQSGEKWIVTGIRTWSVAGGQGSSFQLGDEFSSVTLYTGSAGVSPLITGNLVAGSSTNSNPNITHTIVKYSDGSSYQGTSGSYYDLWQNDFSQLHWTVQGGVSYNFAVDGTLRVPDSGYWFNHASNAALSGSTQQGANGTWIAWAKSDLATAYMCDSSDNSSGGCNGGWDKSSDINVQVFANMIATDKAQCKDGGWQTAVREDGSAFKNQGDCVSYTNNGK